MLTELDLLLIYVGVEALMIGYDDFISHKAITLGAKEKHRITLKHPHLSDALRFLGLIILFYLTDYQIRLYGIGAIIILIGDFRTNLSNTKIYFALRDKKVIANV